MNEHEIWEARKMKDKVLKENLLQQIKVLTFTMINAENINVRKLHDPEKKEEIIKCMGFDVNKVKYVGKYWEYYTYGETELDVYLNILKKIGNKNSVRYPIC